MIYTSREKLTCYTMPDENDQINFSELSTILMERPSNVIYCEKDGQLNGIISMGDIVRAHEAGKDSVVVNRRFTKIKQHEYWNAKQIFMQEKRINALPIVNELNVLMGDYSRWDDLFAIEKLEQLKSNKYTMEFWKGRQVPLITPWKKLALVRPCKEFAKKQELMLRWKDYFLQVGVQVSIVNRENIIDAFDEVEYVVFADENEIRGIGTLYTCILDEKFQWGKAVTYSSLGAILEDATIGAAGESVGELVGNAVLKSVLARGVYVYTLNCRGNRQYWESLQKDIDAKFAKIGKEKQGEYLCEELWEGFFAELYSEEYAKSIFSHGLMQTYADGICKLKNADSDVYKVTDGERRTMAQPSDPSRHIYFYGPCVVIGAWVADNHTIESFLQARLNSEGYKVKCVNYGAFSDQLLLLNRVVSTRLNKGDIVIIHNRYQEYEGVPNIDLAEICERHKVPVEWMSDHPFHCNHKLNSIYADEIYKIIKPVLQEDIEKKESVELKNDFITLRYLERYFHDFAKMHSNVNGSIVMNCNPFTLGHRYLIEQALKTVDHLIIFVVEEDKSIFTFKERFAMVKEGTRDLKNVTVVPSGDFILSQTTFPEYFLKIEDEDIIHNVEYDITLFAEQIAPKLNITYRFVGEELGDKVTNEYNKAMKRILPEHGIHIVEIPRAKTENDIVISASVVREKLLNGENEDINRLIPKSTRNILDICWD